MDGSFNELICYPMWPLPETAMGVLCNCLVGALPYAIRDTIIPLVRITPTPPKRSNSTASYDRPPNEKTKKWYPSCLAQVVSGMFYSVVSHRRQPNLYIEGGVAY